MTPKILNRIQRIYAISITAITILAGICMMGACLGIYLSGDRPYSPEAVSAAFSNIAVVVYLCLAMILMGFVLELILPKEKKSLQLTRQHKTILARLYATKDLEQSSSETATKLSLTRSCYRIWQVITISGLTIGAMAYGIYLVRSDRFTLEDINGSVIRATMALACCMSLPFACAVTGHYRRVCLMEREIAILKKLPARSAPLSTTATAPLPLLWPRVLILTAAVALIVYGFLNGGTADVLVKAINICTECVGLG